VPGCATGEEVYTIAILLLEERARHDIRPTLQVFGTDLDAHALAIAREGRYPGVIDTDMSAFVRSADGEAFALGKQALKRVGKSDDIADVVSFLAGPKARWVTGQVIEATGGSALTF